ncbi:SPOR domain-containing protein [Altererythrobacter salegens]|uniref:SPOR domain-containing protein n=1 Tax=Croceibacterium salegens TaxID=1737568 RepID=A0A6I4SQ66_9SPHN|nr:SPOR domain-containing protein [Croceibacterium salegens]MXO58071.1 SPOR domain-containing protein [Croceibacterium salegens]
MTGVGDQDDLDDAVEVEELAFADEDDRLPWLEADDQYEEGEVDTRRMVIFVVAALALLGAIISVGWWMLNRQADPALVADGSTITAPEEPYKERPDDPGGATAAGTGDASFAVAEGQQVESRVGEGSTVVPEPSIDRDQPANGGVGVQVGAYSSRERAEQGWQSLSGQHSALSGVSHRVLEGTVDGSPIFRLQAVAGDLGAAQQLCSSLKASGADCQVKN